MDTLREENKTQRAYLWLQENIKSRSLAPGDRLVLSSLAKELNTSVVPVREAIRRLEAEGLVTFEPNVGARVSIIDPEAYFETMDTVAVMEGYATALSAPLLDRDDLVAARALNEQMKALLDDFDANEFTRLNQEFHHALFARCPNTRLVTLLFEEWNHLDYFRDSTFSYIPHRASSSVQEHDRLVDLIEAGAEPWYIEQEARRHRKRTRETYREHLPTTPQSHPVPPP